MELVSDFAFSWSARFRLPLEPMTIDAGLGIPGYSLHTELELLVAGGMTPTQALYAATVAPTHFFGNTDEIDKLNQA